MKIYVLLALANPPMPALYAIKMRLRWVLLLCALDSSAAAAAPRPNVVIFIAELGDKLHFQIRKGAAAVDPLLYLPKS